ncbi:MAG: haloacid dehalogenase-like hydrolase [Tepidisphaeraceae bacterium]
MIRKPTLIAVVLLAALAFTAVGARAADPLPSWKDGKTKQAILTFVADVTKEGGPKYVPPEERVATFDQDGTLWCEQPIVQFAFVKDRLNEMVQQKPELRDNPTVAAALKGDVAYLMAEGEHRIAELIYLTHSGMTTDEFDALAAQFYKTAKHPKYGVLLKECTYLPMRELLSFLRDNGFKTYICSGGGIEFMRVVSQEIYAIPPEQVIGSSGVLEYQEKDGKVVLVKTPKLLSMNDKQGKPAGIALHTGRVPIFSAGNVRSGGDIAMLRYCQSNKRPSIQLQKPVEGVSMLYTFEDAKAPSRRRTQYFEMLGNRGIYAEGWSYSNSRCWRWSTRWATGSGEARSPSARQAGMRTRMPQGCI